MTLNHSESSSVSPKLKTINMLNQIRLDTLKTVSQTDLPKKSIFLKPPLIGLGLTIPRPKSPSTDSGNTLVEDEKEWLTKFASTGWLAEDTSTHSDTLSTLVTKSVTPSLLDDSDISWSNTLLANSPTVDATQTSSPPSPPPFIHPNGLTPEQTSREVNLLVKMHREFLEDHQNQNGTNSHVRTDGLTPRKESLHSRPEDIRVMRQGMLDKNSSLYQALRSAIPPPPPVTTITQHRDVVGGDVVNNTFEHEYRMNQVHARASTCPTTAVPSKPCTSYSPLSICTTTNHHASTRRIGGRHHVNPMFLDSVVMRDAELVELIKLLVHVNEDSNRSSQLFV